MKKAIAKGMSYGLTSGVITTLGLMVGLNATTQSQAVVIGGIVTIAIADALSDAFGVHISEEFDARNSDEHVWVSTFSTFFFKLVVASSFIIPLLLLPLSEAILAAIVWGVFLMSWLSFKIAREQNENPLYVVGEHLLISAIVIFIANIVGEWAATAFI